MRLTNKAALLFSSAALGVTFAFAAPQATQEVHANTAATQATTTAATTRQLKDGTYQIPVKFIKTGTNETSTMAKFMNSQAKVTIANGEAKVIFTSPNEQKADMLTKFTVNKKVAIRNGLNWTVTLPVNDLSKLMKGYVEVNVPSISFSEKQTVDIKPNITSIPSKPTTPSKPKTPSTNSSAEASKQKAASISKQKAAESSKKKAAESSKKKAEAKKKADAKKKATAKKHSTKKQSSKSVKHTQVTYRADYWKKGTRSTSTMQQFMNHSAKMYKQGKDQIVVINANSAKSANMITKITLNGSVGTRHGNAFYFNLGHSNLQSKKSLTLSGQVAVSVPSIGFTEKQPYTVNLSNGKTHYVKTNGPKVAHKTGHSNTKSGSNGSAAAGTAAATAGGSSAAGVRASKNSYYNYSAQYLKAGTSQTSVMAGYMLNAAHVVIHGNQATVTIFANSAKSANMITHLSLNGQTASRSGNGYTVTLAKSALSSIIAGHVNVDVPGVIHESQPFSLRLTPGFNGTPSSNSSASDEATGGADAAAMAGGAFGATGDTTGAAGAFPMGAASNLNAANADEIAQAKKAAKQKNGDNKNQDNINNPDPNAQAKAKQQSNERNTFLSIGGIISAFLGYLGTTLGWNVFKN